MHHVWRQRHPQIPTYWRKKPSMFSIFYNIHTALLHTAASSRKHRALHGRRHASLQPATGKTDAFPTWGRVRGRVGMGRGVQGPGQKGSWGYQCWASIPEGLSTSVWRMSDRETMPSMLERSSTTTNRCTWHGKKHKKHVQINLEKEVKPFLYQICSVRVVLTSALTILSTMVSIVSILWHFTTPSKYWERCFRACVTVMSRLLYAFSAAKFYTHTQTWKCAIKKVNKPQRSIWLEITTYNNIKLGVNIHNFAWWRAKTMSVSNKVNFVISIKCVASVIRALLPESSTTGRADTRLSTKMLSALMMGVSGWMKAMSWYVPMPSSPRVCFMKAGFGISHICETQMHAHTTRQQHTRVRSPP